MRIPLPWPLLWPAVKRFLPRSLFGRTLLILLLPMVLAQSVAAYVFFDRHWESLTNRLAYGVAGDVALAIALIDRQEDSAELLSLMARHTDLTISMHKGNNLPAQPEATDFIGATLARNLALRLPEEQFKVASLPIERTRIVSVLTKSGMLLEVVVPERRLYSASGYLFLLWMVGSAGFFSMIAVLFMRNQIRPIRRLAAAAEAFGMGREVEDFRPAGATEVRQAAQAFILMRERIKRQIRQRTEMLAGVSHDLRTPLTRMKLQLALLKDSLGREELHYDITEMERMVEGYLAFARGEGEEQAVRANFTELLDSVVEDAGRISHRPIAYTSPAPAEVDLRVQGVRRALTNLINNALRYGTKVAVTAEITENRLSVHVDDDGPGIPPDKRSEVLRPFVRLEDSRNPETGGVGLGMTIAYDVAKSHGGTLLLDTSPMGGLRVTFRLPR